MRSIRGPLIGVLAGTMFVGGVSHASPLRFTSGFRWFDSGRVAEDLVAADLDGDGTPDLVVSHPFDDGVSVLLGAPGGGFRSRVGFAAGPDPRRLAAFDADRDGHIDVVVTNRSAGTTSLLRGRGDGTLESPRRLGMVASPGMVLARDLDGDGVLDLVLTTGEGEGRVVFTRGLGDGFFAAPVTVHEGAGPLRLIGIDLPGARHHGLAVAAADGSVTVHATTPSGRFRVVDTVRLPGVSTAICTMDANGDDLADLVVAIARSAIIDTVDQGSVRILLGSASGRFLPERELNAGFVPSCVSAVDIDGDGWSDIVAPDRRGGGLGVLISDRAGGFKSRGREASRLGVGRPAAGDWNCDGRVDLVGLEPWGRAAMLLAGQGDGRFGDADSVGLDFGPVGLWLGDLDTDGVADLAATDLFTGRLAILRGTGDGFTAPGEAGTYGTEFAPAQVLGARLRPEGPIDLVIAHSTHQGFLSVARNRGDGTFTLAPEDTVHTDGLPRAFALGDVIGDGLPDVVVGNVGTGTVTVVWDSLGWLVADTTFVIGAGQPVALALGDLDGDAHLDLVVATEHEPSIRVFHGAGNGDFTPGKAFTPALSPLSIALADLDADGKLDLVTGQGPNYPSAGLVVVYRGDGHGAFGPYDHAWTARVGWEPARLLVLDLDGDGISEVVTANRGSSTLTIVPGPTARGFSSGPALTLGTQAAAEALVAGHVDPDGRPDLLISGRSADGIGLLRNLTGDPVSDRPGVTVDIAPGACPNRLATGDGLLRVALVSGGVIDFADLLTHSVRLEGVAPLESDPEMRDESGPVDVCAIGCACDGRAPDGVLDAVYTFDAAAILAALGTTREGESRELSFTAHLRGGGRIEAVDCVVLTGFSARNADEAAAADAPGLRGPNPLSSGDRITWAYAVPAGGAEVRIGVFNVAGRRVARLVHGFEDEGAGTVTWTPRDDAGRVLAPGMYFLRAEVGPARSVARLILVP